jgi:hypothetical protein
LAGASVRRCDKAFNFDQGLSASRGCGSDFFRAD